MVVTEIDTSIKLMPEKASLSLNCFLNFFLDVKKR
jgi:hypothetical protein